MSVAQQHRIILLPSAARTSSSSALVSAVGSLEPTGTFPGGSGSGPGLARFRRALILLDVTAAATEAGDTLDVYLQKNVGPGGTPIWTDFVHFTQVIGTGGAVKHVAELVNDATAPTSAMHAVQDATIAVGVNQGPWSNDWRVKWTVVDVATGGNVSFTFRLIGHFWD